ncbi:MAG: cytochrome c oxidase assembly protein [Magnetospirillum sp. WYHS-4]
MRNAATASLLGVLGLGMVGLAFASVPLYRLFCQATGYGGTPRVDRLAEPAVLPTAGPAIAIRFNADVAGGLPWRFQPLQKELRLKAGETGLAFYRAENTGSTPIVGTATFNVTPMKAASYVTKVECFCFTEQRLEGGQGLDMPVQFLVDPAISDDPETRDVKTITLSYTFFRAKG